MRKSDDQGVNAMIIGMDRIPLAYTFGNHMHWVDMEWLWGYHVLPGSVRDMIHLCREAGIKGCVNFDGIGYEKLASEDPEAFAELKEAIQTGMIEPVGCSYGQPYGLFHGGESNIRQRTYGVRTCLRLFGVRPRTFWEEEFDFFPQLPQMLIGCGFTGASLYFQWTWHTPEIPREDVPVIQWEGHDGTQIPTATRNRLNLHQWPEDMDILLNELAANPPASRSLILQWLELMPSPDWMCRSELILPKLRGLLGDERFDIQPMTLGAYLAENADGAPVRNYSMDEVWHGMTLGKNGDTAPRQSHSAEVQILSAESLEATLSLFGRPYANWDVYPAWEMEEAWRNLLAAQHHDNHECEGLCGHAAQGLYQTATALSQEGLHGMEQLERFVPRNEGEVVIFNPLGWARERSAGAFGFSVRQKDLNEPTPLDFSSGSLPLEPDLSLPYVTFGDKIADQFEAVSDEDGDTVWKLDPEWNVAAWGSSDESSVHLTISFEPLEPLPPGMNAGGKTVFPWTGFERIVADTPFGVADVKPGKAAQKKYPTGDWMISPQWFETVENHFTAQSFVDLVREDGSGVLIGHNGSQQWFVTDQGLENLIAVNDPWDEHRASSNARAKYRIMPHGPISNAERWKFGREMFGLGEYGDATPEHESAAPSDDISGHLPRAFSPVVVGAANVIATAFYREIEEFSGRRLDTYAGRGMGYPFILRLVEFDGVGGDVDVTLPGPIAKAFKTNLMGEIEMELRPRAGDPSALLATPEELAPFGIRAETVKVPMRPHEIATLYLDLVPGRKVARDLDAKREVWATVHRTEPI